MSIFKIFSKPMSFKKNQQSGKSGLFKKKKSGMSLVIAYFNDRHRSPLRCTYTQGIPEYYKPEIYTGYEKNQSADWGKKLFYS